MVLSVFKSGDELFDQGVDLVKRKEFAKARRNFEKTVEKGGKAAALAAGCAGPARPRASCTAARARRN